MHSTHTQTYPQPLRHIQPPWISEAHTRAHMNEWPAGGGAVHHQSPVPKPMHFLIVIVAIRLQSSATNSLHRTSPLHLFYSGIAARARLSRAPHGHLVLDELREDLCHKIAVTSAAVDAVVAVLLPLLTVVVVVVDVRAYMYVCVCRDSCYLNYSFLRWTLVLFFFF